MKVKITLDRNAVSTRKSDSLTQIIRVLGSRATISGDEITVEDGHYERQVIEILNREKVTYTRSSR